MKIRSLKIWLIVTITGILFCLNFTIIHAQDMYIDIIGGGYKIYGPNTIILPPKPAAFEEQTTRADIRTQVTPDQNIPNYIEIADENGGNEFDLNVHASGFSGPAKINNSNFFLKNCDYPESQECITPIEGETEWLNLATATENFAAFGTDPLPLARGSGTAPGKWRIYPSFQLNIPSGTPPGQYSATITFTIS